MTAGGSSGTGSGGGGSVPSNNSAPTISGTDTEGDVLTATTGSWSGSPTSYAYQWEDCNSSGGDCADVASGGTASTYTLTGSDVGDTIVVEVTATNGTGSSSPASSVATSVVTAPSGPVPFTLIDYGGGPCDGFSWSCNVEATPVAVGGTLSGTATTDPGGTYISWIADYFEITGTPGAEITIDASGMTSTATGVEYFTYDSNGQQATDSSYDSCACHYTPISDAVWPDAATIGSDGILVVEIELPDGGGYGGSAPVAFSGITVSYSG